MRSNDQLYKEYAEKAEKQLRQNGYTIYTTIDKDIYERMKAIVENIRTSEAIQLFEKETKNGTNHFRPSAGRSRGDFDRKQNRTHH